MKILFLGTSDFGVPALEALHAGGRHALRVITKPDAQAGRGRKINPPAIKICALKLGLDVFQPAEVNGPEGMDIARDIAPDVTVVVSFAVKLSEDFLDLAEHRGINIHASLLPRYRGASPIPFAILNGDAASGISIIRVAPRMDAGDVLGKIEVAINERDTAGTLRARLSRAAPPVLLQVIDDLEAGRVRAEPQDEALAVKAPRLAKSDGALDWTRTPVHLDRFIRAMTPWPGAFTYLHGSGKPVRLVLFEALPVKDGLDPGSGSARPGQVLAAGGRFVVACEGGALEIGKVQREGRKAVTGAEFLRGARIDPAACFLGPPDGESRPPEA
jgi:methionyl-tRNA formyltransferase